MIVLFPVKVCNTCTSSQQLTIKPKSNISQIQEVKVFDNIASSVNVSNNDTCQSPQLDDFGVNKR